MIFCCKSLLLYGILLIFAAFLWMGNTNIPNYLESTVMGRIVFKPIMAVVLVIAGAAVVVLSGASPPESCFPQSPPCVVARGTATGHHHVRHVASLVDVAHGNGDCLPDMSAK